MAGKPVRLRELGETQLLKELLGNFPASDPQLPGDDCAVIGCPAGGRDLLLKIDSVVEGVHFNGSVSPRQAGRKALCRALSDIAAMGGRASHAVLAVFSPREDGLDFWKEFFGGFQRAARQFGVVLSGGEWSAAGVRAAAVAVMGWVPRGRAILRGGGSPGDWLYVTGRLGGSLARKHWAFMPRLQEGQWLLSGSFASAMMDLSDGLAEDLPRLALASGCGYSLEWDRIPRHRGASLHSALGDGEDYELLFAVPPTRAARLEEQWRKAFPRLPLTRIGSLTSPEIPSPAFPVRGYDHLKGGNSA